MLSWRMSPASWSNQSESRRLKQSVYVSKSHYSSLSLSVSQTLMVPPQLEFEDESQLTVKREEVYCMDEELPKRVKARLVSKTNPLLQLLHYSCA